jgi:3-hydroxybutyryl-CoA dehydrogenase
MDEMIAVIGAGTMGRGVAQVFAEHNYKVLLADISSQVLEAARQEIKQNIRLQQLIRKNLTINSDKILENIRLTQDLKEIREADFVIENITESIEKKQKLYGEMNTICGEECIFMANTSCISITRLGANMKNPASVIGTHFMNPVPLIKAVEVIRGYHTSDETVDKVKQLLESVGKEEIVINDFPGFVTNRISHLMMNEAAFIVQDKVARPEDVDNIFKKCYGHKMGPLETADLIGLDTVVDSLEVLYTSFQDGKFRCCPLLKKMVEAGLLGRKSGEGFYKYQ